MALLRLCKLLKNWPTHFRVSLAISKEQLDADADTNNFKIIK